MDISIEKTTELIHYKIADRIKQVIKDVEPNIIIHGISNSGKSLLIKTIFKELFGPSKYIKTDNHTFFENKKYYIFDLLASKNKSELIKLINEIVNKYDHYNNFIKYVIFENFNNISRNIQNTIKVMIEKSYMNAKFIFITNTYSSVQRSLLNNCLNILIRKHSKYDKYIYIKELFESKNIVYNNFLLLEECDRFNISIVINMYLLDCKYKDIYSEKCYQIINILLNGLNITLLREIIIKIKSVGMNFLLLFELLIDKLIKIVDPLTMNLIIKEIATYNYIINKSYRDIVSIESLFIRLYRIINYEKLL